MKIEDRLHEALHEYADPIEPEPGSWAKIVARFDEAPLPRPPSRRPMVLAGLALALVVVLIAALLVRDNGGGTRVATSPEPRPVSLPTGVLAAIDGARFAVLGAQDGQEHSSLGAFRNISYLTATPDGRDVIFSSMGQSAACGNNPGPDVNRLDLATGSSTRIVGGSLAPAVSPDGKLVAYGTWCDHRTLGFTNIASGGNSRTNPLGSAANEVAPNVETVEPLGWSPDSTRLLYRLGLRGDQKPHYYVGRLWPAVRQAETQVIELSGRDNITGAAFIDNDTLAIAVRTKDGAVVHAVPIRSSVERSPIMFELPGEIISLVADRSGQHFLAVTGSEVLYRWSVGDATPTKLSDRVTAATWVPWS